MRQVVDRTKTYHGFSKGLEGGKGSAAFLLVRKMRHVPILLQVKVGAGLFNVLPDTEVVIGGRRYRRDIGIEVNSRR